MCIRDSHLADLERRLSEEGRFEEFKEKFEEEYGDPWESSRPVSYTHLSSCRGSRPGGIDRKAGKQYAHQL